MFPPFMLVLFHLVFFLLCFPLGELPLSFLALEKSLYLREQDTGQGFHFVVRYSGAVVIGFLFAWHGITPSKLLLVEQITLEHSSVPCNEAAPCVLGNLIGSTGIVQNDLREYIVRPAAYPEIQVVLDLTRENIGVRALGGKNQMDTKGPSQAGKGGKPVFNLAQPLLFLLAPSCLIQQFRHLVTGKHQSGQVVSRGLVISVKVRTPGFRELFLAVFQHRHKLIQGIEQIFLGEAHPAFLVPDFGKIHAALEIGYADLRTLAERLHEQQLQQHTLSAARRAAQQDMGDICKVDRHHPCEAFSQHQNKTFRGQVFVIPGEQGREITFCRDSIDTNEFSPLRPGHFRYDTDPTHIKEQQEKAVAEADKLIANKILDVIRTMLCKDREVQSFEYTEARKAYFTEQMICEILIALEQAAMSFDMEYDDRQKAMSTELSKAARKEWYLRHKDKGVEP